VSGYGLNVVAHLGESGLGSGGFLDFQRLRLMADAASGPASLEVAYEHTWTFRESGASGARLFTAGATESAGDWLELDQTIRSAEHLLWRHRVDRILLGVELGSDLELRAGRQPISWATTLIMTPADPFSPFDPSDPFREYRIGVDALRLQYYPGPFSELELVVRPARFGDDRTLTGLMRGKTTMAMWDLVAWGGVLHDEGAAAVGVTRPVGDWALRGELSLRAKRDAGGRLRGAVGADRQFAVAGRDLYLILEYQHDGFAARDADMFVPTILSAAFRRGELQVLGRDELAVQVSYQWHPLVSVDFLTLGNLRDFSVLYAPGVSYSASGSVSLRAGLFLGSGAEGSASGGGPRSEHGGVPATGYLSGALFY
jgi:hypothetical protein